MERTFRTLGDGKKVDLISYLNQKLEMNPDQKIYIGCDSQVYGNVTIYAAVIVLHNRSRGGHVIFTRHQENSVKDRFNRLWKEVEISINIADQLVAGGIHKPDFIDIDLNPDPKYKSNSVLRSAMSFVESNGYKARCKPTAFAATYVADKLCK